MGKADPKFPTNTYQVLGREGGTIVTIKLLWNAVLQDRLLQAVLHPRQLLIPVELGMGNETGIVIEDGK
ncbi:hypothetical protein D3C71_2091750 [compost metagenome]